MLFDFWVDISFIVCVNWKIYKKIVEKIREKHNGIVFLS